MEKAILRKESPQFNIGVNIKMTKNADMAKLIMKTV